MNSAICKPVRSFPLKPLAAAVLLIYATGIQSAPVFENALGGNVEVTTPDVNTTLVTQKGDRAVANWREFSVKAGETVQFIQDGPNSVILNRVTGEDISEVFGILQATGRVFLINPNGIVFGANSQVNVNGLVASTLSLKPGAQGNNNDDVELKQIVPAGKITNNGTITAKDIVLIAPIVENKGRLKAESLIATNQLTVQLIAASEVTVNTSGDNLVLQVTAGHENALIEQLGTVMAEGGRVVLLATPAPGGEPSVINLSKVNKATQISIQGDTVRLSGDINSGNSAGVLEVNATNIEQTEAVNVGGEARLNAASIELQAAQNDFENTVRLNASEQAILRDSNTLAVQGIVGGATLTAEDVSLGDLNATARLTIQANNTVALNKLSANSLSIDAGSVNQNMGETVAVNTTTHLTANSVTLNNSGNNFGGQVTLNVTGQATLNGGNNLAVRGSAGDATLKSNTLVLGGFATGNLDIQAGNVSQVEGQAVAVSGTTTVTASDLILDNDRNSFGKPVTLNTANKADLAAAGRLEVTGNVNNSASLKAENLVLTALTAAGNLNLKGNTINQTTGLVVQGATRIENTADVNLVESNDFIGDVTLAGTNGAAVHLTDRNNITVGGQAGIVNITSTDIDAGVVTLGNLHAQALNVKANTVSNANTNTPAGAVNVADSTQLTASNVQLANNANDFRGQVILSVSGETTLNDANQLRVHGSANTATLQADSIEFDQAFNVTGPLTLQARNIQGNAPLTVAGATTIDKAASVILNNAGNDFAGAVELRNAGTVVLRDRNSINVHGNADSLTVTTPLIAEGVVTLGELTAGSLAVNAQRITQSEKVVVSGASTLNANQLELDRFENDFGGGVTLGVGGQANLKDANTLNVSGTSNVTHIEAQTVVVNGLTAQGELTIAANLTRQEGALIANNKTFLKGDNVNLHTSTNNTFADTVDLSLAGTAAIHSSKDLTLSGKASEVNATAKDTLTASALQAQQITLGAEQVQLNNLTTQGNLTLNGGTVTQQGALKVEKQTTLGARDVQLSESGNDFMGAVVLNSAGNVALSDTNSIEVQGRAQSLQIKAVGDVGQTGVLNVSGTSNIAGSNIRLNNNANQLGDSVALQAAQTATIHAGGDLELGATNAGNLTATATGKIGQAASTALVVEGLATLTSQSLELNNSANDFKGVVDLAVTGQAVVADQNNLQIQGNAQNLIATAATGTLSAGGTEGLTIGGGTLVASTIELNQLDVSNAARLQAASIVQTQASNTGGKLTLAAPTILLVQEGNDFRGELVLEGVNTATIKDANQLTIGGEVSTLNASAGETLTLTRLNAGQLTANAMRITQAAAPGQVVQVNEKTNLVADSVDLRNNNDFKGAVSLQVSGQAQLRDVNTLSLQGNAGQLVAAAQRVEQEDNTSLAVATTSTLNADHVNLSESGNDFTGAVVLNVSGNATVHDANTLNVAGQVNGVTTLVAQSIEQADVQANALRTESSLLLQANTINLINTENQFNGAVRIEGAAQATLVSRGDLAVAGSNLESVNLTAQEIMLNDLGSIQQLTVAANEVKQGAALLVLGKTTLAVDQVKLHNANNDFVGTVVIQANTASNPVVHISDKNSLAVQGENFTLAAEVQGSLNVLANNLVLGQSTVVGNSNIGLTGSLTQTGSVSLNNAVLKAERIALKNSSNRFNGTTQLDSEQQIALRAAEHLIADTGSSTGALELNIAGNTNLKGDKVTFAQSEFGGNLTVNANEISQTASPRAIEVQGDTELNAVGGTIDLHNNNNRFNGNVSAHAEQTSISANGDLKLLNLTSRGGQITADGRLLLLGNIEQTGGTLTFTARGLPHPLSSAEVALTLPASLDVFSAREAVNPITGLGRIEIASTSIEQQSGQILTEASATTHFNSTRNGSINLTQVNQMKGRVAALAGQNYGQSFTYNANRGSSLFAVNNDVRLRVGEQGVEADLVAVRSRGLSTQGPDAVIHARMPYNDIAVGTARSFPGLTLSIPLGNAVGAQGGAAPFGESSNSGVAGEGGAIRVEVGDSARAGLGGFLTVLPFEGSNLLPGQVVYLGGPQRQGAPTFFYDGAQSLNRIPVVYNGALLLSPQENAALTTAQGAVVLARQEQTRSVVRTENVAGRIINGVVLEVGPGRPATEGEGAAGKPASCDAADSGLNCNP